MLPVALLCLLPVLATAQETTVTTGTLLGEMGDLERLARLPAVPYRTLQFSSYDRRSTGPESPDWYSNADGFGREPVPGFLEVLEEPEGGVGLYLVAEVDGPGAIVRGWSAGMGGEWNVYLDGAAEPVFTGSGYDFLARRSERVFEQAGLDLDCGDAFVQQDADYFPVPFAKGLRITWRGALNELHFYHLNVRQYLGPVEVETFDPSALVEIGENIQATVSTLTTHHSELDEENHHSQLLRLEPLASEVLEPEIDGSGVVTSLLINVMAEDQAVALRGCLLRISFDGSQRPQVEAPVGDFFGSGPGVHPFESLPMRVLKTSSMVCRYPMPFRESIRIELINTTSQRVGLYVAVQIQPWQWDDRSMYFRARWRNERDLVSNGGENSFDLPYLLLRGQGRLVGAACMVTNPATAPFQGGNWWGEGDEKIFVDEDPAPAWFGTGSEDFYNYSWSRPDLFDHPYCGQPLDSGPGTAGHVSNHRFLILDDLPFDRFLGFWMELWQHTPTPGLGYASITYAYARPGALDDHRSLTGTDLIVPSLPAIVPEARGAASGADIHRAEDGNPMGVPSELMDLEIAPRSQVLTWRAGPEESLSLTIPVEEAGQYEINLVALLHAQAPEVRFFLNGAPVALRDGAATLPMHTAYVPRISNVHLERITLEPGDHRLTIQTVALGPEPPGKSYKVRGTPHWEQDRLGLDYIWVKRVGNPPLVVPGAIEAEDLPVVKRSEGVEHQRQGLGGGRWSKDCHLWVRATEAGQYVELEVPVPESGRYRVRAQLTKSHDYGVIRFFVNGDAAGGPIDTFNDKARAVDLTGVVDLGAHELGGSFRLRAEVTGTHPESGAPHYYFGVDYLLLEPQG